MSKQIRLTINKEKLEKIFRVYFVRPFKPKVDINELMKQDILKLHKFILDNVIPDVVNYLKNRKEQTYSKDAYINKIKDELINCGYMKFKKKSVSQFMKDILKNTKTDEEYRREQREKLEKELLCIKKSKVDII